MLGMRDVSYISRSASAQALAMIMLPELCRTVLQQYLLAVMLLAPVASTSAMDTIALLVINSMPIHVLQCMFHVEELFCMHRFFHKYEQTRTEKFALELLLILT